MASRPGLAEDYVRALPAEKPLIRRIFADGAGHVFVVHETASAEAGTAIDVFRESGEFVGRMSVPDAIGKLPADGALPAYATPGYILFAGEDAAGTPYVTRLTIRRGG